MEYHNKKQNTFDRTVLSLCHEIDNLKEEVEFWKLKYEEERITNSNILNQNLESSKKELASTLMFAMSCSDNENGDLVITKENRKNLAEQLNNSNETI